MELSEVKTCLNEACTILENLIKNKRDGEKCEMTDFYLLGYNIESVKKFLSKYNH